ncbi:hypothetical protein ElyMa_000210500 [Elysia marginata]|uniref:Uncharacterized protein n=1 Tax=Elysia marginata TaxID=1093978 RepID=A0AAV4EX54_9GAST|nr:hypothetical protein ElyMa_000210500 [Elysia marginata]
MAGDFPPVFQGCQCNVIFVTLSHVVIGEDGRSDRFWGKEGVCCVLASMVAAGSALATDVDASDVAKPAVRLTSFFNCKSGAYLTNQASSSALVFVLGLAPRL